MTESASAASFRESLSRFASGVVVVTATTPSGRIGFTASAFTSVSLDPPLVLVCIAHKASARSGMMGAAHFGVNVLDRAQERLARQFAQRDIDRFTGVTLAPGGRAPILSDSLASLECERYSVHEAGDHTILVGRVLAARAAEGRPLVHFARKYGSFDADAHDEALSHPRPTAQDQA